MGGRSQTRSQQSSAIPDKFIPSYENAFQGMQRAAAQTPSTPYSGRFTAPTNQYEQEAIRSGYGALQSLPTNLGSSTMKYAQNLMSGSYDASKDPAVMGMITAAQRPIENNLVRTALPQSSDYFRRAGAYGGVRKDLADAALVSEADRNKADVASQIMLPVQMDYLQRQMQAPGMMQAGAQLQMLPTTMLGQLGSQETALQEREIQNNLQAWQEKLSAPWRPYERMLPFLNVDVGRTGSGLTTARQRGWMGF